MQQSALRYRGIRSYGDVTDENNTEELEPRALTTRFTPNVELH